MILWRLDLLAARGWTNAFQLANATGIGYPTAWRVMQGGPVRRVDTVILEAIAKTLGMPDPLGLLEHVPE